MIDADLSDHYRTIARYVGDGVLIPFLGAGVNLCGRIDTRFGAGVRPPSGPELADHLADLVSYPRVSEEIDLVRVSQYLAVTEGDGALYRELRKVFDLDYPPTSLHHLLAALPAIAREGRDRPTYQMIVTTNYDDALEKAFLEAGEEIDIVTYVAQGRDRGKLLHHTPGGEIIPVRSPNRYDGLDLETRPVVMKIHGAVDRQNQDNDSYVITEDHYIDYLTRTELKKLIPANLARTIHQSHFLFLGYSLRDWNLRVILHRIWGEQELEHRSWAVQFEVDPIEAKLWEKRNVSILEQPLSHYIAGLELAIRELETSRRDRL